MTTKFSNRQLFDDYMALRPMGIHYGTTDALKRELHVKGYGTPTEDGFHFHKHVPRYLTIAVYFDQHRELPHYKQYLRENRIGAKYRASDAILTIFLIVFMGTCSYQAAQSMHKLKPVKHYRSNK